MPHYIFDHYAPEEFVKVPVDQLPVNHSVGRINEQFLKREDGLLCVSAGESQARADLVTLTDGTVLAYNGWYFTDDEYDPIDLSPDLDEPWEVFRATNRDNMRFSMGYLSMCEGSTLSSFVVGELAYNHDPRDFHPRGDNFSRVAQSPVLGVWVVEVDEDLERILGYRGIPSDRW